MGETAAYWIPGIVFVSAGMLIATVLPAQMANPIEERGFNPLTIVRVLGWSVAVLGGIILLSIPIGREVEKAFPQNVKVWHWWVNFIGGTLGALMFAVPATLTLPLLLWAYITRPNWVYSGDVESFWSVGYLGLLFTGLGILTLFFLYALGISGHHRRPRWRRKS